VLDKAGGSGLSHQKLPKMRRGGVKTFERETTPFTSRKFRRKEGEVFQGEDPVLLLHNQTTGKKNQVVSRLENRGESEGFEK